MKKHITFLLLALAVAFGAKAQDYSDFIYRKGIFTGDNIIEAHDGNLLMATTVTDNDQSWGLAGVCLYKFTPNGELLDSLFMKTGESVGEDFLFEDDADGFHLFGRIIYWNDKTSFALLKLNDNLDVQGEYGTDLFNGTAQSCSFLLDTENHIIIYWEEPENGQGHYTRLDAECNVLSDALAIKPFNSTCAPLRTPLAVFSESPLRYSMLYKRHDSTGDTLSISVLDADFNVLKENKFSEMLERSFSPLRFQLMKSIGGKHYFLTILKQTSYSITYTLNLLEIDDDLNLTDNGYEAYFMPYYQSKELLTHNSFLIADDGSFYLISSDGMYYERFFVAKIDANLNMEWARYCMEGYEGENFMGMNACTLSGGGIALCGTNFHLELFAAVIPENGWGTPEMEQYIRPYCIYPNPVKDKLSIQFSPDVKPESIELYDIAGRCAASSRTAEMDVANLPSGQYVAKIALEGGKTYTDKIVKQ